MTDDWHTDDFPELRAHPPWVMQEMIEAQPALLERIATTSDTAVGWEAHLAYDPREDEGSYAVVFCPGCASREFCDDALETDPP